MPCRTFLKDLINRSLAGGEQAPAFVLYDGETVREVSFPGFAEDVLRAAETFRRRGMTGRHAAILAPDSYEWCVTLFAVLVSGNTAVLLNYDLPDDELLRMLTLTDTDCICTEASYRAEREAGLPGWEWILFDELGKEGLPETVTVAEPEEDDTLILMGTSGTTGKSKVVDFSLKNLYHSAVRPNVCSPGERWAVFSPLYHIGGVTPLFAFLWSFSTRCFGRGQRYFFADLPHLQPQIISMVPTVMETLSKFIREDTSRQQLDRLIGSRADTLLSGGARTDPLLADKLRRTGLLLLMNYGATETTGVCSYCRTDTDPLESIGRFPEILEAKIEDGEILLRGPSVMKGYYKDPEETAKVIVDGWFHTGDLGYCDADGYFYITGRKKNVIILSNGENVNPEEIEDVLGRCPAIAECLVYSDGKGICADICTDDPAAAQAYVREYNSGVPSYRHIYKSVCQSELLPRTATGKIKRKANL